MLTERSVGLAALLSEVVWNLSSLRSELEITACKEDIKEESRIGSKKNTKLTVNDGLSNKFCRVKEDVFLLLLFDGGGGGLLQLRLSEKTILQQ